MTFAKFAFKNLSPCFSNQKLLLGRRLGLLGLCCCFWGGPLFSQKWKVEEWGEVTQADLNMKSCSWDTSATAMVLQDVGKIKLAYTTRGPEVTYTRSKRVKIFDSAAFGEGNLSIPYRSNRREEKFEDLDVQLILPDGTRKKVKSDNVFTERATEQYNVKKVFIPDLKSGCIIEYRYKLRSFDLYTLYDWYFQEEIPVRWNQVEVSLPEHAVYTVFTRQPKEFDLLDTRIEKPEFFSSSGHNNKITAYGFAQLPALKGTEPFMTTADDSRARIWFQRELGGSWVVDTLSWQSVAIAMSLMYNFGGQYLDTTANPKLWAAFQKELGPDAAQDSAALPEKALRFVSNAIKWDGAYTRAAQKQLDQVLAKGSGGSGEINLAVVALLRRAGLDAFPVCLSTRDHGEPIPQYPYLLQFNTVIASVRLGADSFLLDATNPYHTVNQLNGECYNKKGWAVDIENPRWVSIPPLEESATWYGELALKESGDMVGKFTIALSGAVASHWRKQIAEAQDKGEFLKKEFAPEYPEASLDSIVFTNLKTYDKPLQIGFRCSIPNTATVVNDFLYVKPVLDFLLKENPFKNPSRTFPVSFASPMKAQYILHLTLPPGYVVEELPETARIALPDNGGKIQFSCTPKETGGLHVLLKMNISRLEFPPEEYSIIRQFFDLTAEKTQLQLVLKKG